MILDISIGFLIALGVGFLTGSESLSLVMFGGVSAIAVDIDFIVYLLERNWKSDEFAHEHRDLLHYPIIISLGGGIFFWLNLDYAWALVWVLASLSHFIHDTVDGGWGVRWLYPFDKRYFTLASYSPKRIISDLEEQRQIAAKHGNPNWLKEEMKVSPKLALELTMAAIAVTAVTIIFFSL